MITRRDFLKLAGATAGAALLSRCAPRPVVPTVVPTPVPTPKYAGRKLCFVLWDHQLAKYNYQPRNMKHPVPQTCPLYSGAANALTPEWEAYWRGILRLCNPRMDDAHFENAWISLVDSERAFTNFSGPETGNFAIHSLTCGGATHEMVTGEVETGQHIRIYTLNSKDGPPPIAEDAEHIDMTRHFMATTGSNLQFPDGSYAVYGFPQFENCIIPLVSPADTDLIDASRIAFVSDLQPPYHTWASQIRHLDDQRR